MLDCLHHMLLDGAHGDAQMLGNLPMPEALEPSQNEDCSSALRKRKKGRGCAVEVFPGAQDALRIELDIAVEIRVEPDMKIRPMRRAVASPVCQNASSGLEDVAAKMLDRLGALARNDTGEDVLHEVFSFRFFVNPAAEVTKEPATNGPGFPSKRAFPGLAVFAPRHSTRLVSHMPSVR